MEVRLGWIKEERRWREREKEAKHDNVGGKHEVIEDWVLQKEGNGVENEVREREVKAGNGRDGRGSEKKEEEEGLEGRRRGNALRKD
jgi:hypothetical protein